MKRYTLITAAIAIVLIAMFWNQPQLKAGLHFLAPLALDGTELPTPTPTPTSSPTPTPTPEATPIVEQPEPSPTPEPEPSPTSAPAARFAKCLDGRALTVTTSDSNQTNYRCESGATGAYLNN
jgi:outer membrane biosynthesis protein TonB